MARRARSAARRPRRSAGRSVSIRMYKVGFGDCFLLRIPTDDGVKKMLIDCGSLKNHKKRIAEIASQVIEEVKDADGKPRIDVLVVTHRHADHISGFTNEAWNDVEVGEVWMPWTEAPNDSRALSLRQRQVRWANLLKESLLKISNPDLMEVVSNALSNDAALETIHNGFRGRPKRRYLPDQGVRDRILETDQLPGVTVYVLGPPRDEEEMRSMDPPEGEGFLTLNEAGDIEGSKLPEPFGTDWVFEDDSRLDPRDEEAIRNALDGIENGLAAKIDNWLNNTSLILIMKIGNRHFLFPGDAQWGPWDGLLRDPETRRLLAKATFYKVGHHGSHNATPVDFVNELFVRNAGPKWAMVSVTPYASWKDIPKRPLLTALKDGGVTVAVSNKDGAQKGFKDGGDWIEVEIPVG
jgi:beta-lactamase superfamily II metal-dependent hydrolase